MYAVIYGSSWEDIMYFDDLEKAKRKLSIQMQDTHLFTPFIQELILRDDGVYVRTKNKITSEPLSPSHDTNNNI